MNLYRDVAEQIGWKIARGEIKEGEHLPSEIEGPAIYGISRVIYREVLQHLSAKGLIKRLRRSGTIVEARNKWNLFDHELISWIGSSASGNRLLVEMTNVVAVLTAEAAELAAEKRSDDDIKEIKLAVQRVKSDIQTDGFDTPNHYFFSVVYRVASNEALNSLTSLVGSAIAILYDGPSVFRNRGAIADYQRVSSAIASGKKSIARESMRVLVRSALSPISIFPA